MQQGAHLFLCICLRPAPLFAVPPAKLMATLKAKTIAFILSVVRTEPQATTLAEAVGLVTESPPQGKQD